MGISGAAQDGKGTILYLRDASNKCTVFAASMYNDKLHLTP